MDEILNDLKVWRQALIDTQFAYDMKAPTSIQDAMNNYEEMVMDMAAKVTVDQLEVLITKHSNL